MRMVPAPVRRVRGFVLLSVIFWASAGATHDLWLMAGKYRLAPREMTRVFINSGDQFPESLSLVGEHRLTTVALHGPLETRRLTGFRVDGKSLSFDLQPNATGSHVVAMGTRPRRVRLKAKEFHDYLEENGLERIVALREELGESADAAVERYSKWAKATIDVIDPRSDENDVSDTAPAWSKPVGHTIEIVPSRNPNRVLPGEELEVQLLYEDEPLADVPIVGGKAGGPPGEIKTKTDESGKAAITIPSHGRWNLRSIHVVRVDDDPQVLWESSWCTLTFEIEEPGEGSP